MKTIFLYFCFLPIFLSFSNFKLCLNHVNALDFRRNRLIVSVESTNKRHIHKVTSSSLIASGKNDFESDAKHNIVNDENDDVFEEFIELKSHEFENALISIQSVIRKKSDDLIKTLASSLLSEDSARAVKSVRLVLTKFTENGVKDIFSLYPTKDIVLSAVALSRLQRASSLFAENMEKKLNVTKKKGSISEFFFSFFGFTSNNVRGSIDTNKGLEYEKELLSDLSHYAVFANAAYGWKLGFALSGILHLGDMKALIKKTGVRKEDIVTTRWHSSTYLPAYFIVRDVKRKHIVLCIRGTLSVRDLLTDLCCTAEDFLTHDASSDISLQSVNEEEGEGEINLTKVRSKYRARAHQGMLEAARGVSRMTRKIIATELASNPEYKLVIVGHSLGGGAAAVLGTMWQDTFPGLVVYSYGSPCVGPIDSNPTLNDSIISVISEGDPFATLSLGHIADITNAISQLCENEILRNEILSRASPKIAEIEESDLQWCHEQMELLRNTLTAEKFYPPGRLLLLKKIDDDTSDEILLHDTTQDRFQQMKLSTKMFDISRHIPTRYEDLLYKLWMTFDSS